MRAGDAIMTCQRSKQKILECARELFYQVGYQTTSVDDILKRAGVAKSNFYYHFKSKEQLALAVLEMHIGDFERAPLHALKNGSLDPMRRMAAFCDCICALQTQHQQLGGCPFGNFAAALANTGDEQTERFRLRLSALFQQIEAELHDCLAEGMQHGQFRDDLSPAELATVVLGAVEGLMILTKTHRNRMPLVSGLIAVQRMLLP